MWRIFFSNRTYRFILFLCALVFAFFAVLPYQVLAAPSRKLTEAEKRALGIYFVEGNYNVETDSCSEDDKVPTSINLPKPLVDKINENKPTYVEVANEKNFPWAVIPGFHYRETSLRSDKNPEKSAEGYYEGVYQLHSLVVGKDIEDNGKEDHSYDGRALFPPGPITKDQFKEQTRLAVDIFIGKQKSNLSQHRLRDQLYAANPDPDTIKDTYYSYNGRSSYYKSQASVYGYDPNTQPYEGSAYVMNKYDDKRESMYIHPGTRKDSREGAFTIYAALAGYTGTGCSSSTGANCDDPSHKAVVCIAKAELDAGVKEEPLGSNCGPRVEVYSDGHCESWCADFVSWVYKQAGSPFTGGSSGGWRIPAVKSLEAWLQKNGKWTDRKDNSFAPEPGDIITFLRGDQKHTGLVYSVEGATVTTIEGNTGKGVVGSHRYKYATDKDVSGWGRQK